MQNTLASIFFILSQKLKNKSEKEDLCDLIQNSFEIVFVSVAHTTSCWWRDIARKINWLANQNFYLLPLLTSRFFGVFEFQSCPDFLVTQGADLGLIWGCLGVIILGRNCCWKISNTSDHCAPILCVFGVEFRPVFTAV